MPWLFAGLFTVSSGRERRGRSINGRSKTRERRRNCSNRQPSPTRASRAVLEMVRFHEGQTAAVEYEADVDLKEAGDLGFEPRLTDPESVVLPLHQSPKIAFRIILTSIPFCFALSLYRRDYNRKSAAYPPLSGRPGSMTIRFQEMLPCLNLILPAPRSRASPLSNFRLPLIRSVNNTRKVGSWGENGESSKHGREEHSIGHRTTHRSTGR